MNNKNNAFDFYSVWAQGTALYSKWASSHGISYTELSVLYALISKGSITQRAICDFYGLPKQTVNNCIRHLEKESYIKLISSEEDKREKIISFTDLGSRYCQNMLSSLFEMEEYICRNISNDKFIQAIETRRLYNTLFEKEMERNLKQDERYE